MQVCSYCHLLLGDAEAACPHDGAKTEASGELPPVPTALHAKLGAFEPFAHGQTGTCYLATQKQTGYGGLLKVIPLGRMDASERVRLKRELRKQTQLIHDGLPRIIDGGELGDDLWMFREHLTGESLAQRIRRLGKLDVSDALVMTAQIASALDELQRNGLLHRDVKAGHVIVQDGPSGLPVTKLIDAGLPGRLPTGSVFDLLGTPAYISPEQVAGKLVSFRSDLYGLGCLLFEMLTGAPPFTGTDLRAVLEAHKSTPAPMPSIELPAAVTTLLRALLSKEPRQRPFSAQQVRRTLEPLLPPGASLPALGARPMAAARGGANAAAQAVAAAAPITEEIDLEEIGSVMHSVAPAKTVSLSAAEIEALEVHEEPMLSSPSTVHLSNAEFEALEVNDGPSALDLESEPPGGAAHASGTTAPALRGGASLGATAPALRGGALLLDDVQRAIEHEPEPEVAAPTIAHAPQASQTPNEAAPMPAQSAPQRRAVDFDVESLFDDNVPSEPGPDIKASLQDSAPTQLFRRSEETEPVSALQTDKNDVLVEEERDREGTVIAAVPMPPKRSMPKVVVYGAVVAAAVLLIALMLRGRSHNAETEQVAAVRGAATAVGDSPSAAPPVADQPANAMAAEPAALHAATAPADPEAMHAVQPAAAIPTTGTDTKAAAPAAAAEPPAAGADQPPVAGAKQPAAGADQVAVKPVDSAAAAPEARTGSVIPAAVAAGGDRGNADVTRGAELTAANEAARTQAGSARLTQPRGSRTDRLAKAEEFKAAGRSAYQAAHYRDAANAYSKATEQNPSDAAAFAGLAASRLADGDASGAVQGYSRAVRLQPNSSGFHAALGRAYLQQGDRARARAAYEHALQLDANNGAAKTALALLK